MKPFLAILLALPLAAWGQQITPQEIDGRIAELSAQPAAAPVITVNTPAVRVDNHVAPAATPAVHVTNQIPAQDTPNIKVEVDARSTVQVPEQSRPIIEVKNDVTVEQKPIDVNVHLPDRRTQSEVLRDSKGLITKVTQTETDA